ncbi:MAG: ATP-grasp domain-containing protein [Pseudomonadota bacterium]
MDIARIEGQFVVAAEKIGVAVYDFDFRLHFDCSHPSSFDGETCILRTGPISEYSAVWSEYRDIGLSLVNSPEEHQRCSDLEYWYPLIEDLTPKSEIYEELPTAREAEERFGWPMFVKGARQTSRHNPDLSIIRDKHAYERLVQQYSLDSILHWQKPVIREFVRLERVEGEVPGKPPVSKEYRSFWWHGELVGCDRYWYQVPAYECASLRAGIEIAREAARRVACPFLVVDFAMTADGDWIVIECNDAQESGYAAIAPQVLWRNIIEISRLNGKA